MAILVPILVFVFIVVLTSYLGGIGMEEVAKNRKQ